MSILIVDDDPDTQHLLRLILKTAGYTGLLTADSAQDAFAMLGLDDPERASVSVDLILMDVTMYGIDGVEACRRIKAAKHLQDVPVVMVTGRTEAESLKIAFDAGAIDYITKPLNKVELLSRVRSALQLKHEMDCRKAREQELLEVTKQLEAANQRLHYLALVDGLTGIANRRHFDMFLDRAWSRAEHNGTALALIMIDIDYFKAYNDTYGHQRGDDCLKQVATALRSRLACSDDLIARYGGEEFVIVLPDTTLEEAAAVAEQLRSEIEALEIEHCASTTSPHVTISVGVGAVAPAQGSSRAALIAAADQALYRAKQVGRNCAIVTEPVAIE